MATPANFDAQLDAPQHVAAVRASMATPVNFDAQLGAAQHVAAVEHPWPHQ